MKNIIVLAMLLTLSTSLTAAEKKEKWFGIGIKPDPHLVIPFVGAKVPLPSVCAGKDVSTAFNFKCTKKELLLNFLILSFVGNFPVYLWVEETKKLLLVKSNTC